MQSGEGSGEKEKKRGGPQTPRDCDREQGMVPSSRVQENPSGNGYGKGQVERAGGSVPISSASKGLSGDNFLSLSGAFSHVTEVNNERCLERISCFRAKSSCVEVA